jgi:nucleotidyltransferase substrate binding protein (TIGR01987 family)
MTDMERATLIREIRDIILRHAKPERIYLYGSEASGEAREGSDIDIALDDPSKPDLGPIREAIDKLPTLVKVDIANLATCEPRFVNRVKSTGRAIYSATKALRFEDGLYNFDRARERYGNIVRRQAELREAGFDDIYLDIVVKRFEFTFEMTWKAIKRALDYLGLECKSPRACFQEAHAQGLIESQVVWLDMIEMRNLSSHVYDESEVRGLLTRMAEFADAYDALAAKLHSMLPVGEQ